jgi:hypothetical protein
MKIREEIERYSSEENKPILNWLFDHYHWPSQWLFVAVCKWASVEGKAMHGNRIWIPTREGKALYEHNLITGYIGSK